MFNMKNDLFELNVHDLSKSEKLFLWSIREWLLCIRLAKDPRTFLISPLSKCGLQEAVLPLDKIMRTLAYSASSPIDVRCHCSEQIGRSEIDLLCSLSIKQCKEDYKLNRIIKYLGNRHLTYLNDSFRKLILYFNRANLFFPIRRDLIAFYNISYQCEDTVIYFDFKTKTLH